MKRFTLRLSDTHFRAIADYKDSHQEITTLTQAFRNLIQLGLAKED